MKIDKGLKNTLGDVELIGKIPLDENYRYLNKVRIKFNRTSNRLNTKKQIRLHMIFAGAVNNKNLENL